MNLIAGIITAVVGLLLAILSIVGVIPGFTPAGVVLILLGGLFIGLSFIDKPSTEGVERMSTPSTLLNIFVSPTEVFQNLRRHPRWLVAVIIMSALSATYSNLFFYRLTPERIANFTIDKTLEMPMVTGDARVQVEGGRQKAIEDAKNPVLRVAQAISGFAMSILGYAFLAALFLLIALAFGGTINYWQAFSAVVYAMFPVAVLRFILNSIVLFIKDPTDIHPILGQQSLIQDNLGFLVLPAEHPVIYTILASLSLLTFYWIWLQATGLKNAGERISGSTAWTSALIVFGGMLLLGIVAAFLFPSFLS
ncbi:YIP1 family protein [Leptolyngbya sp. 7M]|uniref:YIP1 family protein n=1 Tax=Leptolyngbya sp. 7M TaxID=2812896 RepID=UPI001B8C73CD|nr:YIP1 family protein [Leptolyngbya sp. 7M]QYO67238.1 YIP1 family protein [Leptolyngbya sp. 7M]